MLAQVSLIPTESKNLIAKAVVQMDVVKQALAGGLVVIHPSSSTYFIVDEITGQKPPTNCWVCGMVAPKGTCVEMGALMGTRAIFADAEHHERSSIRGNPGAFSHSWVIKEGKLSTNIPLSTLLAEMGSRDIYIKGANALDTKGTVGVLWGNLAEGGTAGMVMAAQRQKEFNVIFPIGLEKLVPFSIEEVAKEAKRFNYDYCMGMPCGLLPCRGIVVTELRAIEILSSAAAIPISAGGLGGAEGAITLVIKGSEEQVTKAIEYIEQSKGAKLPQLRIPNCSDCPLTATNCGFSLKGKPWI